MKRPLKQIAELVQARLLGDGDLEITNIASIQSAKPGDIIFVEDEKTLPKALQSQATAVIAGEFATKSENSKPFLISDQPRLAFARAARLLRDEQALEHGTHWTAVVDDTATVGSNVRIEEWVIVKPGVTIGDGTRVAAGCFLGDGVKVGRDCAIYPNVTIYPGTAIGDRVIVHAGAVLGSDGFGYVREHKTGRYEKFPQIGGLEIEDDVEIGANATIDRGALDVTRIGRGTKIDNLVHVGHNVQVGEDVVIAAQTGLSGSAVVENNVVIGGQVGIADHVRVESGAILGAQSGIPSNKVIRGKGVVFWGTPARPIKDYLKELAVLARLAKKEESLTSSKPGSREP
ncbi:MAG: UDP-3-O-(3-hydroxymyristoyl)glucosamine N-acyltransferase [Acidobacteria bacterium]|nr:MAG: UDP-3-O-(3-hydroxymyristoyl)glucosamine N-acyltransferase [Acidobacteriota bacterium]